MADTSNTVSNGAVVNGPSRSTQETTPTKTVGPGAGETVTSLGKTPADSNQLVSVDGLTVLGAGTPQNPLRAGAGPLTGNRQTFQYVWLGTESAAGFPIAFPAPRASVNYTCDITCGITAGGSIIGFALSAKTVNGVTAVPTSAGLTAGDILQVTVQDLT